MSTTTVTPTKLWSGGKSPFNVEYGKLMMWYFLMSDAFTFGAFLISYGTIRFQPTDGLTRMKFSEASHSLRKACMHRWCL
jgi:heme/copper-type cytochrome/quinol oxidase subunit 3